MNYLVQRYVTKSLPPSDADFASTLSSAQRHISAYQRFSTRRLAESTFYEFGAGWDMTIPLAFYAFGIDNQIVVDIRNLLRRDILNLTIEKFNNLSIEYVMKRKPEVHFDFGRHDLTLFLRSQYGIDYRAPCDARHTGLQTASVDCITSTWTLEHIPARDIHLILVECRRILSDDGVMSLLIDYDDHYSFFDTKLSTYNFLQFSDQFWRFVNPPLHYQNRLRHRDYTTLFESQGFEIVEEQCRNGQDAELKTIERMSISDRFKAYSVRDLAVRNALIVLRKRRTS